MTKAQILLVKNSWKLLRNVNNILIGDVFYNKLFIDQPQIERLFTQSIQVRSEKFISMLSFIVSRLDQPEKLTADIRQLAMRHGRYGVQGVHYAPVGNALLWTLEQGLGKDWNEEVREAWTACYVMLSSAMKDVSKGVM